ncbi:hypothetical protein AX14_006961 [Amanita brunnescens Koide BX004]|nr:hypothetical protein AX14_006961 [Amanita brunnescens Koide BX004]
MKFFSTAAVLSILVTISFMTNIAVAVPVESSSDTNGTKAGFPACIFCLKSAKLNDTPAAKS